MLAAISQGFARLARVAPRRQASALAELEAFVVERPADFERTPELFAFFERLPAAELRSLWRMWRATQEHGASGAERCGELRAIVDEIGDADASGRAREASGVTRRVSGVALRAHGDGAPQPMRTFARALLGRLEGSAASGGNLYLSARPRGAQLRAFDLLRRRTPLISFAYAASNGALLAAIRPHGASYGEVTIVDVGIGLGAQLCALLADPRARERIPRLRVVGVDADSCKGSRGRVGALERAEENVTRSARAAGIPLVFTGIAKLAEELTTDDLRAAGVGGAGPCVATCGFTLHHVVAHGSDAAAARDHLLGVLARSGIETLTLAEPDSNHFSPDVGVRLLYAYRHYATIASALCATLPPVDAAVVWDEFFAPEVENVLAHEGTRRIERHEELTSWERRLVGAGWAVRPLTTARAGLPAPRTDAFEVHRRGPALAIAHRGVSLLGVLCATRV